MPKHILITEKPSVAMEFAKVLGINGQRKDGYIESNDWIITWCVGHLVTMSYPEKYDEKLKVWRLDTLPFIPKEYKYEIIPNVEKQFNIIKGLLQREDIDEIYNAGDSGREGEYIQRLVLMMAKPNPNAKIKRVWIDSQTEDEILRGIREAKDLSEYDNLSASAYLRAKEDYLMGINFSRILTLKYGNGIANYLGTKYAVISVGRVMTCVLGMVVRREREIRQFVKTPFYRVLSAIDVGGKTIEGEWKAVPGSRYENSPALYKENGFKKREDAENLISIVSQNPPLKTQVDKIERKKENKNAPLLFNLAELQNECAKLFKISPDETLKIVQEMYEKKLVTYPRTDARVLSTAVAKEIYKNIRGLTSYGQTADYAREIIETGAYKNISKSRYVNDKQITDHYAIIPTGQGLGALNSLSANSQKVYEIIARRFLSIFYPSAVYQKISIVTKAEGESFFSNFKVLLDEGYLKVAKYSFASARKKTDGEDESCDQNILDALKSIKKGDILPVNEYTMKEGETSPPKRYTSGSMILAMENAGQLIEDEDLRAQIKGSGIGTSATRAEILKKLIAIKYLALNKKTQVITPTLQGEMIFDVVNSSIRSLLNPELTASWEKGLTYVAEGSVTPQEYMDKLEHFIRVRTDGVKNMNNQYALRQMYDEDAKYYKSNSK